MTIVEIMIVVTIIGILAVIAMPAIRGARLRSQDAAFKNDLRILTGQVFTYYSFANGDFPPDAAPGVQPPEVLDLLPKRFDWTRQTPIGGRWDWDRAAARDQKIHGVYAGLSVHQPGRTAAQMREIDADIDDGDLAAGLFQSRDEGYIYILAY